jgi:tetratricopeptide (TPR) repeat protein
MYASNSIFLSYRRSTSKHLARAIFEHLQNQCYDTFLDVNTIDSGAFDQIILNQIAARPHFVVLLSPGAFDRCVNADDWLRREIEEAMKLQRNIIPIVEEGFDFMRETQHLPDYLRDAFRRYNALPLIHFYFDAAMDILVNRFLKEPVAHVKLTLPSPAERAVVERQMAQIVTSPMPIEQERASRSQDLYRIAYRQELGGDLAGALATYTEAIRVSPESPDAYYRRGNLHYKKGNIDKALSDYHQTLRLNPRYIDAYIERAEAFSDRGDHENALNDYAQAIIFNPHYARIFYHRAGFHIQRNELMQAVHDYQKYLDLGGGQQYDNQKQVEQRIAVLQKKAHKRTAQDFDKINRPRY